jgi:sulfonate transport system substrate-binding protein
MNSKRWITLFALLSIIAFVISGCGNQESKDTIEDKKVVRVGYQKGNTVNVLKARGTLEKALSAKGYKVEWTPFTMGTTLMEALNAGSIDFGHASDGNSVFAQATGKPIVYTAAESPYPKGVAIVVPENSPIHSVKDLKGKKVGISKGGNMQYLLVRALKREGMSFADVKPIYFKDASEARALYDSKSVDALGIWDPYLAVLEKDEDIRTIVNGENGLTENRTYYFASPTFAEKHSDLLKIVLDELNKSDQWSNEHPTEVAQILSKELGIDQSALETATKRRQYGVQKMIPSTVTVQQDLADTFYELKLIPKKVNINNGVNPNPNWLPESINQ